LRSASQEEEAPAQLVYGEDGDNSGDQVDSAGDDSGVEGGLRSIAQGVKENGGVEHDGVDASELLEELKEGRDDELGAVVPPQDGLERMLPGL
jgi:hypothetical protein